MTCDTAPIVPTFLLAIPFEEITPTSIEAMHLMEFDHSICDCCGRVIGHFLDIDPETDYDVPRFTTCFGFSWYGGRVRLCEDCAYTEGNGDLAIHVMSDGSSVITRPAEAPPSDRVATYNIKEHS